MKQSSTIFLQGVIVLIGVLALGTMIRFPSTEGRAENLDLFSIYADPFILYIYTASIPFFIALYKVFKLLGYIRQNEAFSINVVSVLKSIKYCAIVLSTLILLAGLYIKIFHDKNDDPAGFFALCFLSIFVSLVIATAISVFENIIQNGMDIRLENEQFHMQSKITFE
jgi:hypothetical protein